MFKIDFTDPDNKAGSVLAKAISGISIVADDASSLPAPSQGTQTGADTGQKPVGLVYKLDAPATFDGSPKDTGRAIHISGAAPRLVVVRGRALHTSGGGVALSWGNCFDKGTLFAIEIGGYADLKPSIAVWDGDLWDRSLLLSSRPAAGEYVVAAWYDGKTLFGSLNGGDPVSMAVDLHTAATSLVLGAHPHLTGSVALSEVEIYDTASADLMKSVVARMMANLAPAPADAPVASEPAQTPPVAPPVTTPPPASVDQPATQAPAPSTTAPAAGNVTITAPTSGSTVSGAVTITGMVPDGYVNVAAYDETGVKVAKDAAPVNGAFTLAMDATKLVNGEHKIAVVAFAAAAGTLGGSSIQSPLQITVEGGLTRKPFATDGMKLVFEDTFSGSSVDLSKWYPGPKPSGAQHWSDGFLVPADHPRFNDVYSVKNGALTIKAIQDDHLQDPQGWNRKWYAGELSTARPDGTIMAAVRKGVFEGKMKFQNGKGTWPGFWLLNTGCIDQSKGDPGAVEIDIEAYGFSDAWNPTVHNWPAGHAENGPDVHDTTTVGGLPDLSADFHTYSIQVTDDEVIFYFDHVEKWRHALPRAKDATLGKFFLLIDNTVGGGWPIVKPESGYFAVQFKDVRIWEDG